VGATIIFASHELDRATNLAQRTVDLVGGTLTATPRVESVA
jgi:ABC-type proline/glycine betaine transport system ATPase subunit